MESLNPSWKDRTSLEQRLKLIESIAFLMSEGVDPENMLIILKEAKLIAPESNEEILLRFKVAARSEIRFLFYEIERTKALDGIARVRQTLFVAMQNGDFNSRVAACNAFARFLRENIGEQNLENSSISGLNPYLQLNDKRKRLQMLLDKCSTNSLENERI